ncbi:PKD domain-containing protein [Taibaiella chishuiensis]|uniref:Putative secreted protein (Por secretion system target) n=1 Tax=Taibaiella chishuiensis TaxID=1434707 RepID=A0A2P8DBA4_9BACT|nr:PKD domain-containing protein [Taibaiella chishuiensis]PSK94501.1 putative secreted protein (Por secretion system target) [Taibaiella chishuiensis]
MKLNFTPHSLLRSFTVMVLLAVLGLAPGMVVYAQVPASSYSYAASSGTYTDLVGGTSVSAIHTDDATSGVLPIGFTFNFCGVDYTQFVVNSNGFLSFKTTPAISGSTYNSLGNMGTIKPAVFPLWADQTGSGSAASYGVTGTAGNRVFTMEFKNWKWNYNASAAVISYQIKLFETTNVIQFVYRPEAGSITGSSTASIGICDNAATPTYLSLNNSTATATVSSTTFTTSINTKPVAGQIYQFTPPPNCATATFPTAATTTVTPGTICISGNVTLNVTTATAMPNVTGVTYKWQSSTNGTTWVDIAGAVTTVPTYTTTTPISTPLYFRAVLLCNGTTTILNAGATAQVVVNNPGTPVGTGGTRCGPGSVTLSSTTPSGATLSWYQNATGGLPLGTGSPFTTPYIPGTTTFYVSAGSGTAPASQWVGTGTTTFSSYNTPYYDYYWGTKVQYLIKASELNAAGLTAGTINSMGFDVTSVTSVFPLNNFYISIKSTSTTALAANTWETGLTQVFSSATYSPVANTINNHTLSTPFVWDGSSNIVIEVCHNNPNYNTSGPATSVKYSTYTYNTTHANYGDNATQCTNPASNDAVSMTRPNILFGMTLGCQGTRVPVVATVTAPPALTKTAPAIICNGAVATFSETPNNTYTNYSWTPVTDLYSNTAGTTAYTAGANAPTVYFKSTTVGAQERYLYATNSTTGCAFADTVRTWVQPDTVVIKAAPDTICNAGTASLWLVPTTGYAPNSIQWQESTDGTTYTNIAGQTGTTYTTASLTANRYYRVQIKSAGATPCLMPVKYIVVAHPALQSKKDSFNCGPGTVTLEAAVAAGSNSAVKWYATPTSSQPIGVGSPWTTPFLGVTDTYYVAASTGTPQPDPANVVVAGSLSTTYSTDLPFYYSYSGQRVQWMITAAEMTAQGFTPGLVKSIGFDIAQANMSFSNVTLQMGLTTATSFGNGTTPGTTYTTGLQQVFSAASFTPVANQVNTLTLQTPFYWDGTSNIIINYCHSGITNGSFSNAVYMKYRYNYTYPNNMNIYSYGSVTNICGTPSGTVNGPYSSYYRPHTIIGMMGACESTRQPVIAYIHPKPVVNLGADINRCVDNGAVQVLDAGVQPNTPQFLWDDNSTSQVRAVTQSGTYRVTVTNSYTCKNSDTIQVTLRKNPVVNLGNDTTVCNGVVLNLNAGNDGISYFWSTGQTTNTINISNAGTYIAFVTNSDGCMKSDTIQVIMQGQLPTIQGISVTNNGAYTFHYTAVNPQNVIGYDWNFGDGSPHSYQASPTHTFATAGNYIVTLQLSSTCGFRTDSSSAQIVGIHQITVDNNELMVYPNPASGIATLQSKNLKMEEVTVYNVLGQAVQSSKADSPNKHTLKLEVLAAGVYTIQVRTDKGNVARKLEILK